MDGAGTGRSVLAIGAHPDDIELGCGGALLAHVAAGDDVTMLVITGGENGPGDGARGAGRRAEQERAAQLLLKPLDAFGQRGLGDVAGLRRTGEVQRLRERQEVADLHQVHRLRLLPSPCQPPRRAHEPSSGRCSLHVGLYVAQPVRLRPPARRGGEGGGSEITAQLLDRVAQLEDDVRRLRGQMDEQANASRRQSDDLAKQVADLNFRLQNSGPSGGPGPRATGLDAPAAQPAASGPAPSGRRPAELAMQEGNAALARRDYAAAEAAAREVLGNSRAGPRAGDAQFLLAQALMGKRDYAGAAVAYDDAYSRSRTGSRAPDALVGLANALAALNDRANACGALDKLRAEFPAPRPNIREAAAAARGRSGCP